MLESKDQELSIKENIEFIQKILNQKEKSLNDKKYVTQSILEIICYLDQSYQAKNSNQFVDVLMQVQELPYLEKFLDQSLNYLQLKLIIWNNLSYFYQTQWKNNDQDINSYINCVEQANKTINMQKQEIQNKPFKSFFNELKTNYSLILSHMQLCAVYSHQKNHKRALDNIDEVVKLMEEFIKSLKQFLGQEQHKIGFSKQDQIQIIQFLKEDQELLSQMQTFLDDADTIFAKVLQISRQSVRKSQDIELDQFQNHGKKLDTDWAKNMNMGYFVHSKYLSLSKIHHTLTIEEIFSESFFSLLVLMISCILFLLSNETRIYCVNEIGANNSFKIRTIYQKTHVEKLKKTSQFIFSSLLHERAIELLGCYYTDSQLQKYMIKIYEDNYKPYQNLDTIKEERESVHSVFFQQNQLDDIFVDEKQLEKQIATENKKLQILKMAKNCLQQGGVKRQKSHPSKNFKKINNKKPIGDQNSSKEQNNSNINIFKNYIMIGDINQTIFKKNNIKISNKKKKDKSGLVKKKLKKKVKKEGKTFEKKNLNTSPEKIQQRIKEIFGEQDTGKKQEKQKTIKKPIAKFTLIKKYIDSSNHSSKAENIKTNNVKRNTSKQFKKAFRRKSIQSVKNVSLKRIKPTTSIEFKKNPLLQSCQRYFKQS